MDTYVENYERGFGCTCGFSKNADTCRCRILDRNVDICGCGCCFYSRNANVEEL